MKTVVIGASNNPDRYSYKAAKQLLQHKHEVVLVSNKKAEVFGIAIETIDHLHEGIDTITLYVGPQNQAVYKDYIINCNPRRVIFNPGTENPEMGHFLEKNGIIVEEACTLVLLSTGQY
ncbi:MAG: CoA-binding protein [Sphingobacteriales bacterium]|jgi:predicted CoA-binding protein|nr:CoA-binding protein [Sphingobacteriales bacterium]